MKSALIAGSDARWQRLNGLGFDRYFSATLQVMVALGVACSNVTAFLY